MQERLRPLPNDWNRALVFVAHPDDVEYGAAAAVASWTAEGKDVSYVIASRGETGLASTPPHLAAELRTAEQRAAAEIVGVRRVEFLEHPDGLIEYGTQLRRDVTSAIRRTKPDLLLTLTHRRRVGAQLNHPDHRAVGIAVLDGVRDAANRWLWPDVGPAFGGVRYICMAASPEPTHAVDVTGYAEPAIASLAAHTSYLAELGVRARPLVEGILTSGGQRAGTAAAVVLELQEC